MRNVAVTLVCALLFPACFGSSSTPQMQYFWLPLWENVTPYKGEPLPVVIQVESLDVEPAYDHLRIVYRVSPVQLQHYRVRQWVVKPGRLFKSALWRYLQATRRFQLVVGVPRPLPNYVLRGRVLALEQMELGPKRDKWYARVSLHLRLHRAVDGKVIWSLTFDDRARIKVYKPGVVVAGMTSVLRTQMERNLPKMVEAIKQDRK